jgi:membrane-associated phospholipid phosphatase
MADDEVQPGQVAGSRVDAGAKTESGPLGRVDPPKPAPPGTVPRPPLATATLTIVVGLAILIALLVVLGFVAEAIRKQEVFILDTTATPFLHGIQSPFMDALMNTLTTIGSSFVIPPIFIVSVILLARKRRFGAATFLGVAAIGGTIIEWAMKLFFARPRPQLAWATVQPDYSFPSGHTMNTVVFYAALALIIWSIFGRRTGAVAMAVAVVLTIGVGISRIYLGYHYLTDVVAAILAGTAWLLVVGFAFRLRPKWWAWGSVVAVAGTSPPGKVAEGPRDATDADAGKAPRATRPGPESS